MAFVRMFPAKQGDCFLVRESLSPGAGSLLIDGGFESTFRNSLLPELARIGASGEALDLVVVTHIDEDHILGVISLIKANGNSKAPAIIPVKDVWHNSLRSITSLTAQAQTTATDQAILTAICGAGFGAATHDTSSSHEISGRQGSSLARLLKSGNYVWNGADGRNCITSSTPPYKFGMSATVHVLGPKFERLDQLRSSWLRELRRVGVLGKVTNGGLYDDAFEFMNATGAKITGTPTEIAHKNMDECALRDVYEPDTAPNNGSSISMMVEIESARLLFLADAWAEDVIESIEPLVSGTAPLKFDLVKVSHHGSRRNTSSRLLELIDAPVFLISTDGGKHNHPDLPVLRAIVDRPADFVRHIHFSYSTEASRKLAAYKSRSGSQFVVHENSTNWIEIEREKHA